jgi:hypothetical protein
VEETWQEAPIRSASAEALVLMKLIAFRRQDLVDIESLLAANRGELDLEWIRGELASVIPADDPRLDGFNELVDEFYRTSDGEADQPG